MPTRNDDQPIRIPRDDDHCDVLLVYVNEKERAAIVETFAGLNGEPPRPRTIRDLPCFDLGTVGGRRIFATATNMGSATPGGSATLTVDAITKLNPQRIIAVGVAFGMDPDKAPIGTILVSDRVSCYEPQRAGKKIIHRGDTVTVHPHLKQLFQNVSSPPYWNGDPVRFGQIISGEKLIDDPAFKGKLRKAYPEAIGGEMEAAGIYSAALLKQRDWIIVKAVCDYADGNKGEDKDNRQTLAAGNAARFVRHVLTAYDHPASTEEPGPPPATSAPKSERKRATGAVHRDAVAAIAKSLDLIPELCTALAGQPGVSATKPAELAEWLCALNNDISNVFQTLRNALSNAVETLRGKHDSISRLTQHARDILGWMAVTTVLEDYEQENALAKRWKKGAIFRIPLGRGPCVEVLVARWKGGKAEFGIEPSRFDYGKYDITPKNLGEIGFGKDLRPDPDRAVDYVLRKAYQEIFHETALGELPKNKVEAFKNWLDIQLRNKKRWRLVIDQSDLNNELNCESYVEAISTALPPLHLFFINSNAPNDDVFVVSASLLDAEIYACLHAIKDLS